MAIALKVVDTFPSRRRRKVRIQGTVSGNYPTNGDTADFTALSNPNALPMANLSGPPSLDQVVFHGSGPNGLDLEFVVGATLATAKIKMYTSSDNEHANGAYAAHELADPNFVFTVEVPIGH